MDFTLPNLFTPWDAANKFGFSRYWGLDMIYPLVNVYSLLLKMVIQSGFTH